MFNNEAIKVGQPAIDALTKLGWSYVTGLVPGAARASYRDVVSVEQDLGKGRKGQTVKIIDFDAPENNDFLCIVFGFLCSWPYGFGIRVCALCCWRMANRKVY